MDETAEKLTSGEALSVEQLLEYLPALKEVPAVQLEKYAKGAAVLHRYRKGETVCVEGEFGSFQLEVRNVPSENPRTGRLSYLSTIALLRDLGATLRVGT